MSITCLEARRQLLAEPSRPGAPVLAHIETCSACNHAWRRARDLEQRLEQALKVAVPETLSERILLAQTTAKRRRARKQNIGYALAAGLMLALVLGVAWRLEITPVTKAHALERYVAAHMRHEPQALVATEPVAPPRVSALLAKYRLALGDLKQTIVWARECPTPEGTGVHLVVQTRDGPVTFLYLPAQRVDERIAINEHGFQGYVENFQQGVAVVLGSPGEIFDRVSAQLLSSMRALAI